MAPKATSWRLWAGLVAAVIGILAVGYQTYCPKGFVRFSGYEAAGSFSCIEYGGISTPEHYLSLKEAGRVSFFGAPLAGEGGHPFLMRTPGTKGKWICGTANTVQFSFGDGEASIENASVVLDEAEVQHSGEMTISGLAGGVFGDDCKSTGVTIDGDILQLTLELTSMSGGASQDLTRLDALMSGGGLLIAAQVDLASPWPERGEIEREVRYGWVRLTEVIEGRTVRRLAVAGPGSVLVRKAGCATLELRGVTPLAACPAEEPGKGTLKLSW